MTEISKQMRTNQADSVHADTALSNGRIIHHLVQHRAGVASDLLLAPSDTCNKASIETDTTMQVVIITIGQQLTKLFCPPPFPLLLLLKGILLLKKTYNH